MTEMGLLTAITIGIALIVDFLFLPALLLFVDGGKKKSMQQDGTGPALAHGA